MKEALVQNGASAAFDSLRTDLLADHQKQVLDLLGTDAYGRLQTLLDTEVRGKVRIASGAVRMDPH